MSDSISESSLFIRLGFPITISFIFSSKTYFFKNANNSVVGNVVNPEAIIHNGSVTAMPERLLP